MIKEWLKVFVFDLILEPSLPMYFPFESYQSEFIFINEDFYLFVLDHLINIEKASNNDLFSVNADGDFEFLELYATFYEGPPP